MRFVGAASLLALSLLGVALAIGVARAEEVEYYVDPVNGDDANNGSSWASALRTITRVTELVGAQTDPLLYLAEGVFSQETGERFPITFSKPPSITGVSPDSSIIDAGSSVGILENTPPTPWGLGDWLLASLRIQAHSQDGQPISSSSLNMQAGGAFFENVHFVGLSAPGDACIISLAMGHAGGLPLQFTDCLFLDCSGRWLLTPECSPFARIQRCLFTRCFLNNDRDAETMPCGAYLIDCRFQGPGCFEGFDASWELLYLNCAFEDYYLQIFPGQPVGHAGRIYWPGRDVIGCSFKNSTVQIVAYGEGADFRLCAFDPASELIIVDGSASVCGSCSSFLDEDPDDEFCLMEGIEGNPMFVAGPLGGCYLSNRASGQMFSSPCLSGNNEPYRGWPPEGSTTRTDGVPDGPPYDLGYHYPSVPPPPPAVAVRTNRAEYAVGDEMKAFMTYENRGVKVEGAIYFAFGPDTLDWLIFWPWMTFVPTPWFSGTLYSGVSYQNLPPTTHTIPESLAPGGYLWLGAVLASDGTFASDVALCPVTIRAD